MLRKLRRLSELPFGELLVLLQLSLLALMARIALTFLRLSRVMELVGWAAHNHVLRRLPVFQIRCELTQLARLTDYAARGVRPNGPCLLRSLLLFWLLKARGKPAELLIGVSKETALLQSHAWIESQGRIIGDPVTVTDRFATLVRF